MLPFACTGSCILIIMIGHITFSFKPLRFIWLTVLSKLTLLFLPLTDTKPNFFFN